MDKYKLYPDSIAGFNQIIQRKTTKTPNGRESDDMSNLNKKKNRYQYLYLVVGLMVNLALSHLKTDVSTTSPSNVCELGQKLKPLDLPTRPHFSPFHFSVQSY